jgi:hypothetical protein
LTSHEIDEYLGYQGSGRFETESVKFFFLFANQGPKGPVQMLLDPVPRAYDQYDWMQPFRLPANFNFKTPHEPNKVTPCPTTLFAISIPYSESFESSLHAA